MDLYIGIAAKQGQLSPRKHNYYSIQSSQNEYKRPGAKNSKVFFLIGSLECSAALHGCLTEKLLSVTSPVPMTFE